MRTKNRVYYEDCLKTAQYIEPNSVDLVIADPPYFGCVKDEWDNQWDSEQSYFDWLFTRLKIFTTSLNTTGNMLVYCKRQFQHKIATFLDKHLHEQRIIIWARRRGFNTTRGKTLGSGYEPILWYSKSPNYFFNSEKSKIQPTTHLTNRKEYVTGTLRNGVSLTDAWLDIPALPHNSREKLPHPTQKPLKISKRIVSLFSPNNGLVVVPFAGSGSELVACLETNRNYIASEINQKFHRLITKRLQEREKKHTNISQYF